MTGRDSFQFPDEFIDPFEKKKKKYCMAYAKAFDSSSFNGLESALFRRNADQYEKWRKLANGKQDPDRYMKQVGVKGGKNGKSWKALDTSILPIAPKFVELLVGKIISKGYDSKGFRKTTVKGIDRQSAEEEKQFKAGLSEQVINQEFVSELNEKGISMPMNDDGTPVPDSLNDVDTYAQIFRKDEYAIEAKDAMTAWFDSNNFEQTMFEVVDDLVKITDGGTCTDLDVNGNIKIRRVVPERMISNNCRFKDFRDLYRVGEYIDVTISELKQMWPGQEEKVYREIAEQAKDQRYGLGSSDSGYPYDKEKITVLHARWLSTDKWVHVSTTNEFGAKSISKKSFDFPTDYNGNAVPLKDYSKKHPNKEVINTELQNVYQCKWIVGTSHCFDNGLVNNIQRTKNSLYGANLGFHLYHLTNSIMEKIEPIIHMIQVAWLQHQNHVARSKPSGLSIEMSAMEGLGAGKNKDKLTMKEAIRMYFDTGVVFWRRKNYSNASNQFNPITELKNNISNDAEKFLAFIFQYIDLLRNILGINEVEDASTPNPEILKGVAQMAALGTKHALKDLYQATKTIFERTAKSVIDLTPDSREISKHKGFENALGTRSDQFWKELGVREMGIIVEEGPDDQQKQALENAINKSVDKGAITPDEAYEFLIDDNLTRAAQQLRDKIKKSRKEAEESQMRQRTHESDENIRAAQAVSEAKAQEFKLENDAKKDYETHLTQELAKRKAVELRNAVVLTKLEKGMDLDEQEEDHLNEMEEIVLKGEIDIKKEKAKPKPTMAPMGKK